MIIMIQLIIKKRCLNYDYHDSFDYRDAPSEL